MAKQSIEAREVKRENCIKRYAAKRAAILKQLRDPELDFEERLAVQKKLNRLPRNSAAVRHTRRCQLCGRPHAVYRKFSLCRICVRQTLMVGDAPGGTKSSW